MDVVVELLETGEPELLATLLAEYLEPLSEQS